MNKDYRLLRTHTHIVLSVLCLILGAGCAPEIAMDAHTVMRTNGVTERTTVFTGTPNKNFPDFNVRLSNYLATTPQREFDDVTVTDTKVRLSGQFVDGDDIPADYYKLTENTDSMAKNRIETHAYQLGSATTYLYEEAFDDILNQQEGKQAAAELLDLLIGTFLDACGDIYNKDYDLMALQQFFRKQVRALGLRLYDKLWEVRKQSLPITAEAAWWRKTLSEEGARIGLSIQPEQLPGGNAYDDDLFKHLLDQKLRELTQPRSGKGMPLTFKKLKKDRFGSALQDAIGKRYGSPIGFYAAIDKLFPRAFGAYAIAEVELLPLSPHLHFHQTVTLPGTIYADNAVTTSDTTAAQPSPEPAVTQQQDMPQPEENAPTDSRSWNFTHRELAFHGKTLQACSVDWAAKKYPPALQKRAGEIIAHLVCSLKKQEREPAATILRQFLPVGLGQQDHQAVEGQVKTIVEQIESTETLSAPSKALLSSAVQKLSRLDLTTLTDETQRHENATIAPTTASTLPSAPSADSTITETAAP